jgi:hypothetical protein
MSNAILIQQVSGPITPMLELTAGRHADYCGRHRITYWPVFGDVQFSRTPHWNKIALIQQALALGFETVAWLDADTMILQEQEDIRNALNGGPPLALARHPMAGIDGKPGHWNSGVMIMRNTPQIREFFDIVWDEGPVINHWWKDQARILDVLQRFPQLVQQLDDRWNSTVGINDAPDPIIKAWHGYGPNGVSMMYDELKRIGALDDRSAAVAKRFLHSDNVLVRTAAAIDAIPPCPDDFRGRGIVIPAGGAGYFPCAWVCIHQLRRLGCQLPIQLWYLGPGELDARMRSLVAPLGVECVDADVVRRRHPARILNGWESKPYSILHCPFREVLLLDSDNVPVLNPEFLFDTPEFRETGAIFWPDYRRMPAEREAWAVFDVPYRDEPEFESGQIVMDKVRCWRALKLTMWFNEYSDFFYNHVHGDKDTFRFAWHRVGQRFAMPPFPIHPLEGTMCQHDFTGRRLFQHRNTDKWNVYRDNKCVDGFLFEEECQADVRRLRQVWDGTINKNDP